MTFIGIDIGTSSVKAVLVDARQHIIAIATQSLTVDRPRPSWSEQNPQDWVAATLATLQELKCGTPSDFRKCASIGLSGQMHGAVLLDQNDEPLRPCILWDDGRSAIECGELEREVPSSRAITGNMAMPGFTAPKLAWVRKHEPEIFRRIRRLLLPKAYVRLALCGEAIEDMSDASGTLWLDVARREWSDEMLAATGLDRTQMPRLVEGSQPAGRMRPSLSRSLGFDAPPLLAGGAGDNAAGAVGLGFITPGDSFLSLGTSGVLWRTTAAFEPRAQSAVHSFCHAVSQLWHQMSVHLSAASCLHWWASVTGTSEAELLAPLGEAARGPSRGLFTPYLSGERTPYNDSHMRGGFAALGHDTDRDAMTLAVLEGVAFAFREGKEAIEGSGTPIDCLTAIGGGSRSRLWLSILANVLDVPVRRGRSSEAVAACGAARLARLAETGEPLAAVCHDTSDAAERIEPDPELAAVYRDRHEVWQRATRFSQELGSAG